MSRFFIKYKKLKNLFGKFIKFFLKKILKHTNKKIQRYGPFKMDVEYFFANFNQWGSNHNDCLDYCLANLKKASCFIDVGAHIGLVTLPAAINMSKGSTLISFEPSKINYSILKKHIQLNKINLKPNIFLLNTLVGECDKSEVTFYDNLSDSSGTNSLIYNDKNTDIVKVKQISLDSFCLNKKLLPDVIKIDVEGYEYHVLIGAKQTIIKNKPKIIISIHPKQLHKINISEEIFFNLIDKLNYELKDSSGNSIRKYKFGEFILVSK
jgi:FkbM family methyltransferase